MRYDVFAVLVPWLGSCLAGLLSVGLFLLLLRTHAGPWWSFMITFWLVNIVSFGVCGTIFGLFLTDEAGSRLFSYYMFLGASVPLVSIVVELNRCHPKSKSWGSWNHWLRLNLTLSVVGAATFAVAWGLPWLYFQFGRKTVGVAVSRDEATDTLDVSLYGPAVNRKTLRLFLERKILPGAVESIDVFGFLFLRGFLPYDPHSSPDVRSVQRMKFRRTKVGDGVIPVLKQFSGLTFLDLRETNITAAGVQELQAALPNCQVIHRSPAAQNRVRRDDQDEGEESQTPKGEESQTPPLGEGRTESRTSTRCAAYPTGSHTPREPDTRKSQTPGEPDNHPVGSVSDGESDARLVGSGPCVPQRPDFRTALR